MPTSVLSFLGRAGSGERASERVDDPHADVRGAQPLDDPILDERDDERHPVPAQVQYRDGVRVRDAHLAEPPPVLVAADLVIPQRDPLTV